MRDHHIPARMTRAADPATLTAQIRARATDERLVRHYAVRQVDAEARTVELAFASSAPVMRWFGEEVLSLDPGAMRTDRLDGGMALLMDHDWTDQVGVVVSHSVTDGIARAVVRFGRSARASEVLQDIVDGVRRHVSVGYEIYAVLIEERSGQPDLVTMVDWEPLEISIVAVPADLTVGIGRSAASINPPEAARTLAAENQREQDRPAARVARNEGHMNIRILRDSEGRLVRAKVNDAGEITEVVEVLEEADASTREALRRGTSDERARVAALMNMGSSYGQSELAQEFIAGGRSVEDFRAALLERMAATRGGAPTTERGADVGLTEAEADQFSFIRALRALANPGDRAAQEAAAFEREAGEAAATRLGRSAQGIMVPPEVLRRALNTSTTATAAGDTGGYLIATDLLASSFIDLLRNRTVLTRLATPLTGLVGLVDIPKLKQGTQGYWIGEDTDAPETSVTVGQIGLRPKTCAAFVEITRRMLMQSSIDVEAMLRRDLAAAMAGTIDYAGFYGTGTGNQPLGIAKWAGVNAVDFGGAASGAGGSIMPTWKEIVQMETEVAADNADFGAMAYVLNARMRGHLKTTEKFAGSGRAVWEDGDTVNGYRTEVTNQIQNEDVFFGNFADAILGMWGGLDLTVDPYSNSKKGRLRIVAFQDVDFVGRRVESFTYGTDAT